VLVWVFHSTTPMCTRTFDNDPRGVWDSGQWTLGEVFGGLGNGGWCGDWENVRCWTSVVSTLLSATLLSSTPNPPKSPTTFYSQLWRKFHRFATSHSASRSWDLWFSAPFETNSRSYSLYATRRDSPASSAETNRATRSIHWAEFRLIYLLPPWPINSTIVFGMQRNKARLQLSVFIGNCDNVWFCVSETSKQKQTFSRTHSNVRWLISIHMSAADDKEEDPRPRRISRKWDKPLVASKSFRIDPVRISYRTWEWIITIWDCRVNRTEFSKFHEIQKR
jgi:hypothetical protein